MAEKNDVPPRTGAGANVEEARPTANVADWVGTTQEARTATENEHSLTILKALKLYPKACFWSMVVSLAIIMDGYDTALIGTLQGFPAFQKRFGVPNAADPGTFQVQPKWMSSLGLASPLGNVIGIFINGILTERYGHKKVLLGSVTYLTCMVFMTFFAPSVEVLFVGELLCGLAWGVFSTMGPAYASEVTPMALRAYLETWVVLCWGMGQLISYGVLDSLDKNLTDWAWRIPFAVQWVWPVIIFPLASFCPESPWWLVRQGRIEDAEKSYKRLSSNPDPNDARNAIALMVETTELERNLTEGATYADCFKGDNLYRTEIGCVAWACQVLVGFALSSYATYFFEQAGLQTTSAYKLTVGQGGLHFVCTCSSVLIFARHGRRSIFNWGCIYMGCMMFVIGFVSLAKQNVATGYVEATFYLLWFCGYELTIGPASYIIVGETSSTRLRSKSIALARNLYNVFSIISSVTGPYILNPTADNWKGHSAFLAGGFCLLSAAWGFLRLPECKGRTYEELDILFSKKLKPWEFKNYVFDREIEVESKFVEIEHTEHLE